MLWCIQCFCVTYISKHGVSSFDILLYLLLLLEIAITSGLVFVFWVFTVTCFRSGHRGFCFFFQVHFWHPATWAQDTKSNFRCHLLELAVKHFTYRSLFDSQMSLPYMYDWGFLWGWQFAAQRRVRFVPEVLSVCGGMSFKSIHWRPSLFPLQTRDLKPLC